MPMLNEALASGDTMLHGSLRKTQTQLGGDYGVDVPNLQELTKKYQEGQPDYSPEKMTEGMLGRFRSEMRPAMQEAVLGAQTHAARSGQAYGDVAGRALGQAVGEMAPAAGDVVAQGQQLGTQAELQQKQMAQEMARVDATMQMEAQQFVQQIEAEFQMLDKQLRAQERIAMTQASSQEEVARIQQQGQMARTKFITEASQKAETFAEQQKNWRHQQQLQYLGKAEAGKQTLQQDYQAYLAAKLKQDQLPGTQPGGEGAEAQLGSPTSGISNVSFGGSPYSYQEGQWSPDKNFQGSQISTQPQLSSWEKANLDRVGTTQLNKYNTEWWR